MKKYALVLSFIFWAFLLNAQLSTSAQQKVNEHLTKVETSTFPDEEYFEAAMIYYSNGDNSNAIKYLKKALQVSKIPHSSAKYNRYLAIIYREKKDYNKAIDYFKEAFQHFKNSTNAKSIGNLYQKTGQYRQAIPFYNFNLEKGIDTKKMPLVNESLISIAECYQAMGKQEEARKYKGLGNKPLGTVMDEINNRNEANSSGSDINWDVIVERQEEEIKEAKEGMDSIKNDNTQLRNNLTILSDTLNSTKQKIKEAQKTLREKEAQLNSLEKILQNRELALIVSISVSLLIVVLTYLAFRGYRIKKRQHKQLELQKNEIEAQAVKLNESNSELQATLENLKSTQSQLIQSEKMASLGQLIAGIAHELNTPLGAIKSSIGSVQDASAKTTSLLPELIQKLTKAEFALFLDMLNDGFRNKQHYTSREERKIKRGIRKELEAENMQNADEIAETMIDIGVHEKYKRYSKLFKHKSLSLILQTAYYLAVQNKNSSNIKTAVDRAAKIIYALKSYSHTGSDDEKIVADITESINTVLTIYHNQLKHGVEIEKDFENLPKISCYPDQLNQVWTNLLHNALQAMNGKGKLKLSAKKSGENVIVGIGDSGTGIPENIRDKIFQPFFTTKAAGEGTGLGLDIIKKIVERHKGDIRFETETGKGTTFYISLPIK